MISVTSFIQSVELHDAVMRFEDHAKRQHIFCVVPKSFKVKKKGGGLLSGKISYEVT